jgi:hypothetical protein
MNQTIAEGVACMDSFETRDLSAPNNFYPGGRQSILNRIGAFYQKTWKGLSSRNELWIYPKITLTPPEVNQQPDVGVLHN